MEKVQLKAEKRESRKGLKSLRKKGFLPGVAYGKDITSTPLQVNTKEFKKTISGEAGQNVIIELNVDGENYPVLIHEIQINPLSDQILHVDFHKIRMDEKIKTKVPVETLGVPIGHKEGGILVQSLREVELECLPTDIPDKFEIDVTQLNINDSIHVSQLPPLKGVDILTPPEEVIVNISPPAKEEEVAPPPTAEEVPTVEGAEAEAKEEGKPEEKKEEKKEAKPEEKKAEK